MSASLVVTKETANRDQADGKVCRLGLRAANLAEGLVPSQVVIVGHADAYHRVREGTEITDSR